ncbi:MAG: hypothetical protein K9N35_03125 [Candidatus Marinimicrobia bacterium]|nr:hypothetical protein [Candidatus Neomarinimicrobiota bacterium]
MANQDIKHPGSRRVLTILILFLGLSSFLMGQEGKHSGIVKEILESGGYSYFQIEEADSTFWIAVRLMPAIVGAKIEFEGQMWMVDFHSKTMNRTFPRILFAANAQLNRPDHKMMSMTAPKTIHKTLPGFKPIIEVKRSRDVLNNHTISIQGEAIKVLHGIMGKTWIHLSDGESDSSTIVITTGDNSVDVGMRVTAKGVLTLDKDFGAGYFYPNIIEDAEITK